MENYWTAELGETVEIVESVGQFGVYVGGQACYTDRSLDGIERWLGVYSMVKGGVMIVKEGTRVKLTGRAWGYQGTNREVYARITFSDHAWARIDDRDVLISGMFVNGFEFEVADEQ